MGRTSDAKERLISTANNLFRDRGFEAVSVAQLCEAAAVNKGSFYYFFRSKRDLLLQVIDGAWDETGMLTLWETELPPHPIDQLRKYLQELFAYHYADRESAGHVRGSLFGNLALELSRRDPLIAGKLDALLRREVDIFTKLLAKAINVGETTLDSPSQTAQTMVACLHGLLILAKAGDDLDILPNSEAELLRLAGVVHLH